MGGGSLSLLEIYGSAAVIPRFIVERLIVATGFLLLRRLTQEGV
jgi:hypothetical protein